MRIDRNLKLLYVADALYSGIFVIPVVSAFFRDNGLSYGDIFTLQAVFSATMLVLELPTGYVADRYGRKTALVLGSLFGIIGIITYATGHGFWQFCLAEILLGFLVSFFSGTVEAFAYEILLNEGRPEQYSRTVGALRFWAGVSQALASIIGGCIALFSLRATLWATLVPFTLLFLVSCYLIEPQRQSLKEKSLNAIVRVTYDTAIHPGLAAMVLVHAILGSFTLALVWFTQSYQLVLKMPLVLFGFSHAAISFTMGYCAKISHHFQKRYGDCTVLVMSAVLIVASYFYTGVFLSYSGILFFLVGRSVIGFINTVTSDVMNRMTTSDVRATVLSVRSFAQRIVFTIVGPLVGCITDFTDVQHGLLLTGFICAVTIAGIFFLTRKMWETIPQK